MKPRLRPHPNYPSWWLCGIGSLDETMGPSARDAYRLWVWVNDR